MRKAVSKNKKLNSSTSPFDTKNIADTLQTIWDEDTGTSYHSNDWYRKELEKRGCKVPKDPKEFSKVLDEAWDLAEAGDKAQDEDLDSGCHGRRQTNSSRFNKKRSMNSSAKSEFAFQIRKIKTEANEAYDRLIQQDDIRGTWSILNYLVRDAEYLRDQLADVLEEREVDVRSSRKSRAQDDTKELNSSAKSKRNRKSSRLNSSLGGSLSMSPRRIREWEPYGEIADPTEKEIAALEYAKENPTFSQQPEELQSFVLEKIVIPEGEFNHFCDISHINCILLGYDEYEGPSWERDFVLWDDGTIDFLEFDPEEEIELLRAQGDFDYDPADDYDRFRDETAYDWD